MTYKFTGGAKNAIEYANEVTLKLGHEYIGTEHILYGLAKESSGIASKVLEGQNVTAENIYVDCGLNAVGLAIDTREKEVNNE